MRISPATLTDQSSTWWVKDRALRNTSGGPLRRPQINPVLSGLQALRLRAGGLCRRALVCLYCGGERQFVFSKEMGASGSKRTWPFYALGGKCAFAATANASCQKHESGHSGLRFDAPPCCTRHQGQQCAESALCKVKVQCLVSSIGNLFQWRQSMGGRASVDTGSSMSSPARTSALHCHLCILLCARRMFNTW